MLSWSRPVARACFLLLVLFLTPFLHSSPPPSWNGVLRDAARNAVGMATVKLFSADSNREYSATTSATGQFAFTAVAVGNYTVTVSAAGKIWTAANPVVIKPGAALTSGLTAGLVHLELGEGPRSRGCSTHAGM